MPNRGSRVAAPREYASSAADPQGESNQSWPGGPFIADTPAAVFYAAEVSKALTEALKQTTESVSAIAEALGIARSTIYDIVNGQTWADSYTLASIEAHLNVQLWPRSRPTI